MGAWPTLQAATGKVSPGGYHGPIGFAELRGPSGEASRARQAQDPELAQRLWDVSVAMTGNRPRLAARLGESVGRAPFRDLSISPI